VARHRSPDGRSVLQTLPPPVHRRRATGTGTRQAVLLGASVRRGAVAVAAVTATGGFLAVGATPGPDAPPPALTAYPAGAAAALTTGTTGTTAAPTPATRDAVVPVPAVPAPAAVVPPAGTTTASPLVTAEDRPEQDRSEQLRRATEKRAQAARAAEKVAAEQKAAAEKKAAAARCAVDTSGLGPVKAPVRSAAQFLGCRFHESEMYGVAGRGGPSDHPRGLAVDFMTDRVTGDALASCVLRNQEELGVSYVIWQQRINTGSGWEEMEDRGDATANHLDHVHVSFTGAKGGAAPRC
jgi:uncharacterized protein YbdZ (MbtH family)